MSLQPVVDIQGVSREFGAKIALDNVSLQIPVGAVTGLVGENGAGKTTLIKHVLGLLKAESGAVRVFGVDPVQHPVEVLSRIGYLSEESDLPDWMRVHELMRYAEAFYPTWDRTYANQLREDFGLSQSARLRTLSKGQRARAGLMVALAYRPDLLVLDEPSSGLDPIVRRDILGAIIRTIAEEGRTVLFSSHLLGEVERVSDRVAMIRGGKIVFHDSLEEIAANHMRLTLRFEDSLSTHPTFDGALSWNGAGREWTTICAGNPGRLEAEALLAGAKIVEQSTVTLDEIFVARTGASSGSIREDAA